jgi:hypothetical protein
VLNSAYISWIELNFERVFSIKAATHFRPGKNTNHQFYYLHLYLFSSSPPNHTNSLDQYIDELIYNLYVAYIVYDAIFIIIDFLRSQSKELQPIKCKHDIIAVNDWHVKMRWTLDICIDSLRIFINIYTHTRMSTCTRLLWFYFFEWNCWDSHTPYDGEWVLALERYFISLI